MHKSIFAALLLAISSTAIGAVDPISKLRSARSLRCQFTSTVETIIRSGHQTVEQTNDKGSAVYVNINVAKGTARIVANSAAGDLAVWIDRQGNLWMLERSNSGNEIVTTVFPMYAEGTTDFVVLESRHWLVIGGQIADGETAYGTCTILE